MAYLNNINGVLDLHKNVFSKFMHMYDNYVIQTKYVFSLLLNEKLYKYV